MIRYGKETKREPAQVLARAITYFGPEGQGLAVTEQDDCHVSFEGGGGFVTVRVCADKGKTEVDLAAREWERQARDFISAL